MHVSADQSRCIGAGNCVMAAPEVFDQRDEDGIVIVLQESPPETLRAEVTNAVQMCPASILRITETDAS